MFNKIGEKIQIFAELFFGVVLIGCIIAAMFCWANDFVGAGFLVLMIGPLSSYISALFIAGFGKLIENSDLVAEKITKTIDGGDAVCAKVEAEEVKARLDV